MKSLALPLILSLLFISCRKDEVDYELRNSYVQNISAGKVYDTAMLVMTYNIRCGFSTNLDPWNKHDTGGRPGYLDSLSQLIKSSGADIVALQEVPLDRTNTIVKRLLDSLAHRLDMSYAFAAHGYNDAYESGYPVRGQWGVAILSRFRIEEMESREVSYTDVWTRRSTLRARLSLNESKSVDVYSLHHKPVHDYSDLQKTAGFVHESSLPKIVCGDFNLGPRLVTPVLGLSPSLPDSLMGIDLIYHSPEFTATDAKVQTGLPLSDHNPIWVQLRY